MFDRNTEMDMTEGPLFKKLVAYAIPIMLTGILQLLFNAADLIVVGRFAGRTALAAVGSTTSLTNLLVNVFMMISIGVSVAVAQHYGAHEPDEVERTVSTAMLMSLLLGAAVCLIGMAACKPMLKAMGSPDDVIDQSVLYMRIYFTGMPAFMVYNFGASALRAVGDTRRPMQFLTIAGIINVILNVITVLYFNLGVAGVAIATSVSQYVSAIFVVLSLVKTESCLHLDVRHMRIHRDKMLAILKVGLPAGLQSFVFSISNVVIQSSVNSFGSAVMAGSAASNNVEGFIYTSMNAVVQSAMAFTGQNIGPQIPAHRRYSQKEHTAANDHSRVYGCHRLRLQRAAHKHIRQGGRGVHSLGRIPAEDNQRHIFYNGHIRCGGGRHEGHGQFHCAYGHKHIRHMCAEDSLDIYGIFRIQDI